MSLISKAIILGLLIGIAGLMVGLIPFGLELEESFGLDLLFKLRGVRQPPSDVIIVSIDKTSSDNLNLSDDLRKWPRSLHARLIENLVKEGASVIAFDISFLEPSSSREDNVFADAIGKARNVVLCKCLKTEKVLLNIKGKSPSGNLSIVSLVPPIPPIAQSAFALAPFPLPKVPVKVSQYWTFKTVAGDTPTLPIVAFQIYTMQAYDNFIQLLEKVSPDRAQDLPRNKEEIISTRNIERVIRNIREIFDNDPMIAERMLEELQVFNTLSNDDKQHQMIKSLIKMYQSNNSQYLNFYGPPHTIHTVSYYQVLLSQESVTGNKQIDVKGKAVFIGHSPLSEQEQKERFYTVFSQPDGLDLSGVEIAATALANLVEDKPVLPLRSGMYIAIIFLWGIAIGILSRIFTTVIGPLSVIGLSILYLIAAEYQFKTAGNWYPVVLPLFFQMPLAVVAAVVWKYIDSIKERQNIKKAFKYYLPDDVVDQLAKNISSLKASNQLVYGICLSTDAEQYTSLSEKMSPEELGSFMNKYYETVFKPIMQHGGTVSDIKGDSILAVWVASHPEATLRYKACLAALDIESAIHQFKQDSDTFQLPTRIGLHSGHIMLGSVGAIDHYEYRPVGDIVNTATRMEGLNKYLGTRILVSSDVINQLGGLQTRELGKFLLVGKSKPLVVHELICRREESSEQQRNAIAIFAEALDAFRRQSWDEAFGKFNETIEKFGEDGPSHFYLKLCEQYKKNPPDELWDGVVRMDKK